VEWILHSDGETEGAIARLLEDERIQTRAEEDYALIEMRANDVAARAHAGGEACRVRAQGDADERAQLELEQV
jgi:hypothetical protein